MTRIIGFSWHDPQHGLMWPESAVLQRTGWTRARVRRELGEPDVLGRNPHGGAYVRLYSQDRVRRLRMNLVLEPEEPTDAA